MAGDVDVPCTHGGCYVTDGVGFFFEDFRPNGYFIFLKKYICFLSCEQNHLTYPSKIPPTDLVGFCRWFSSWWSLSRSVKPSRFRPVTNLRNRIGSKLRIRVNDKTSRRRWWRLQRKPPLQRMGVVKSVRVWKIIKWRKRHHQKQKILDYSQVFLHKWWRFKNDGFIRVIQLDSHRARALCTRHKFTS